MWVAARLPRKLVYFAGLRVLSDATRDLAMTRVCRQVHQGEVRMKWALESWINRRP